MSLYTFFKLVGKAFRYTLVRPVQRFNVANRAKKYLGPDSKYFMPAPRAIGPIAIAGPSQYPHLTAGKGFKSVGQRRLQALEKSQPPDTQPLPTQSRASLIDASTKSYSQNETDDMFVRSVTRRLEVMSRITNPEPSKMLEFRSTSGPVALDESPDDTSNPKHQLVESTARPLPKCVNLPLQDIAAVWHVDKVPPGRLSLNQLQELLINKIADDEYWTTEKLVERYNIGENSAKNICQYLQQIRIVISPNMANKLDLVGKDNAEFQASKHIVYHVDKRLRSEKDKMFDKMYLESDQLPEEVKELLEPPKDDQQRLIIEASRLARLESNRQQQISDNRHVEGASNIKNLDNKHRRYRQDNDDHQS